MRLSCTPPHENQGSGPSMAKEERRSREEVGISVVLRGRVRV